MSPALFDEGLDKVHDFGTLTEFSIGRSPNCQINILQTHISRYQCTFVKTISEDGETEWKIENKSTFKTTYVNKVPVGAVGTVLKNGDTVSVGPNHDYKYIFYLDVNDMPPTRKRRRLASSCPMGTGSTPSEMVETRKRKTSGAELSRPEAVPEIARLSPVREADVAPASNPEPVIGDSEPNDVESLISRELDSIADELEPFPGVDSQPVDLDDVKLPDVSEQTLEEFVAKCKVETFAGGNSKLRVGQSVESLSKQLYKALLENQKSSKSLSQLRNKLEATEQKKAEAVQLLQSANEETSKLDNDLLDALKEIDRLAKERNECLEEVKNLSATAQQQQSSSELETELVFKAIENEELLNENTELKAKFADLQQKYDAVGSLGEQVKNDVITLLEQEFFCAVCNDLLYQPVTISCRHTFCSDCLREWKKKKMECPSCRTRITAETSPLIVDNFIDRVAPVLGGDFVAKRREAITERTAPPPAPAPAPASRRGGRRTRRAVRGRRTLNAPARGEDGNFAGALARYISDIIDLV